MITPEEASRLIKEKALELGFSACGIAPVRELKDDATYLKAWLNAGYNGQMDYMANHFEKRTNPALLVENAQSVIVVLLNYATDVLLAAKKLKIARYVQGDDYHLTVKQFLGVLFRFINETVAPAKGRMFCDSAPVLERRWAQQAGLGWTGLNRCLIHPKIGSFCFIGELVVDLKLGYDEPAAGDCGNCKRCVEACPTKAIEADGTLNASRCLSYLTGELKDDIPQEFHSSLQGYIAGCDSCQNVCPWNKEAANYVSPLWKTDEKLLKMDDDAWRNLSEEAFKTQFAHSPLQRLGYKKLKQNIDTIT